MTFDETYVLENCENLEQSYGEICVKCNKCGRYSKKKDKQESEDE